MFTVAVRRSSLALAAVALLAGAYGCSSSSTATSGSSQGSSSAPGVASSSPASGAPALSSGGPSASGAVSISVPPSQTSGGSSPAPASSASEPPLSTATGTPYVVGAVTPLSGSLAFIGSGLKAGTTAYYNYVNAHGGINGHPIKLIALDDGGDVNKALTATHQLVQQDNVIAISGWVLTNIESAVQPYAVRQNTVMMAQGCDSSISNAANKVSFCAALPEPLEDKPLVDFAATKVGSTTPKVAVIDMNSQAQVALQNRIVTDLGAKKWPVALKQLVDLASTDETAQANAVVQSGAT